MIVEIKDPIRLVSLAYASAFQVLFSKLYLIMQKQKYQKHFWLKDKPKIFNPI